jgi:hypothetical protein
LNTTYFLKLTPLCTWTFLFFLLGRTVNCLVSMSLYIVFFPIFALHWTLCSNQSNLATSTNIGREKKKREERSETPKPNEAVTNFDGNLYSTRH